MLYLSFPSFDLRILDARCLSSPVLVSRISFIATFSSGDKSLLRWDPGNPPGVTGISGSVGSAVIEAMAAPAPAVAGSNCGLLVRRALYVYGTSRLPL